MTFGEKLQNLRKSKSMSQEDLAEKLSVSRQAVSKWELDQSLPDITNIIAISKIFSVSTDYLLLDKEPDNNQEKTSKEKIPALLAIISAAIGFLGNFIFYILSRFIKVPGSVRYRDFATNDYVAWRIEQVYDFSDFIAHHNLEALYWIFVILFTLGISILIYLFRSQILKALSKLKSLKKN